MGLHPLKSVGWICLSVSKRQRCSRWSLGIDTHVHPTLYWACKYLSMLGLKLIHVSKRILRRELIYFADRQIVASYVCERFGISVWSSVFTLPRWHEPGWLPFYHDIFRFKYYISKLDGKYIDVACEKCKFINICICPKTYHMRSIVSFMISLVFIC